MNFPLPLDPQCTSMSDAMTQDHVENPPSLVSEKHLPLTTKTQWGTLSAMLPLNGAKLHGQGFTRIMNHTTHSHEPAICCVQLPAISFYYIDGSCCVHWLQFNLCVLQGSICGDTLAATNITATKANMRLCNLGSHSDAIAPLRTK